MTPEEMIECFLDACVNRHKRGMVVTFNLFSAERKHTVKVANFRNWVRKEVHDPTVREYLLSDEIEKVLLRAVLEYCDQE